MATVNRLTLVARAKKLGLYTQTPAAFYDPERDGITFSALNAWQQCRELSRLGLNGVTSKGTSFALVFGTLVHALLQTVYEATRHNALKGPPSDAMVKSFMTALEAMWNKENPMASADAREHAELSLMLAEAVMPRYFRYWHEDFTAVRWMALEHEFRIPYAVPLPDGRVVKTFIRGKMDGNFRQGTALKLFETKSQGQIDEEATANILPHDLQSNIYLWAMRRIHKEQPAGVRYNIIRRPQLRQKKDESLKAFAYRCALDVAERPDFYFVRMDMDIERRDMDRFEGEFDDMLRDFCAWWYGLAGHYKESSNCRNRYGTCWMLPLCGNRDFSMLYIRDTVFRELGEV